VSIKRLVLLDCWLVATQASARMPDREHLDGHESEVAVVLSQVPEFSSGRRARAADHEPGAAQGPHHGVRRLRLERRRHTCPAGEAGTCLGALGASAAGRGNARSPRLGRTDPPHAAVRWLRAQEVGRCDGHRRRCHSVRAEKGSHRARLALTQPGRLGGDGAHPLCHASRRPRRLWCRRAWWQRMQPTSRPEAVLSPAPGRRTHRCALGNRDASAGRRRTSMRPGRGRDRTLVDAAPAA